MKSEKNNLREAIRRIIRESVALDYDTPNVSTGDRMTNLKRYVEDNINLTGYGEYENTPKSRKLEAVKDIFKDERGWDIKNQGLKRAFIDYLRGMPGILDIATYYNEVKNLLYSLGYDEVKSMDDGQIDKLYYNELYKVFFGQEQ